MVVARDIMTTDVAFVRGEASVRDIATLLADRQISAVPVVDDRGSPIGMVSEGDLIGRSRQAEAGQRREWWLELLAEGETLNPAFIASLQPRQATAAAIMSAPIVAVDETTEIGDIARLLEEYRIKRVPVLRAGQMVGIVSRADLVRAIASGTATGAEPAPAPSALSETLAAFEGWRARAAAGGAHKTVAPASAANSSLTAERFRALVAEYRKHQRQEHASAQRAVAARAERDLRELIEHHIDDGFWQATLTKAAEAARHGEREFLLLRFPNRLCSDGGRAINAPLPDWPKTLRGEAAELYIRWQHDLQPHGFRLVARVLEFPGGFPGDIGLFLAWDR